MCMTRNQYVHIHLPCQRAERIQVASWYTLVPMHHTNLNRIVHDRHRQRKPRLVIVALDEVYIGRYGPQVVVRLLVADVARAEDLLYFTGNEEFLEFEGEVMNSVRDVEVTNNEDEDHCGRRQTCFVKRTESLKLNRCNQTRAESRAIATATNNCSYF